MQQTPLHRYIIYMLFTKMGVVLGVKGQVQCSQDLAFIFYRIATPDECAGTVSFLSSDDASYVTGETIVIAGGSQSRL